jgi:hypothetical protein
MVSIFSITTGSLVQAITFTGAPHSPQVSISMLNISAGVRPPAERLPLVLSTEVLVLWSEVLDLST